LGQSEKYADLIVGKVPARKLLDILIQVFHRRTEPPGRNVELFIKSSLKVLNDVELYSFWQVVSESLENATTDAEFRTVISIAQNDWEKIAEIARLRAEHRLIESIREGEYNNIKKVCTKGSLGTWATRIVDKMDLNQEYRLAVASRLMSIIPAARAYAYQYHFDTYRRLQTVPWLPVLNSLKRYLKEQDQMTYNALIFVEGDIFASETDEKWIAALKEDYAAFVPNVELSDDDIPF
jgi:hypothetical protein